jgi:mannose-1-phosphate guanylyltransferase
MMEPSCYSVIIAGGKGTRFWPLSRSQRPKQLLKIFGPKTLIGETAARVLPLGGRSRTLVVTVIEQFDALRGELRGLPKNNFIVEPLGKNTGPCIGLAALEVAHRDPAAVMIAVPADHWVPDVGAFRRTLRAAVRLAREHDQLVTVGIRPAYPETGYGYIFKGKRIAGSRGTRAYQVKRFKEKPSLVAAQKFIRHGSLWNSGIFICKAATLLELLKRYHPVIWRRLERMKEAAGGRSLAAVGPRLRSRITHEYARMPSISIDHAVVEKAASETRVLTLEGNFRWNDIGSWAAVHRMLHADRDGNAGNGRWLGFGAKNCLIHASDRFVVLLGIENAVVVDTPDALLVGDLKRSQEVRELVEHLKQKGYGSYTVK